MADSSGPQSLHRNDRSIPSGTGMAGRHTDNISTACKIHELTPNPWNTTFQADMVAAITKWMGKEERIIIFIDMSEHILHGILPKELLHLGLHKATHTNWEGPELQMYVYGDGNLIDGVYHTSDLKITSLMQLSFRKGIGDHRLVIIDVTTSSAIGRFERRVIPPRAHCLATRNKYNVKSYLKFVTKECQRIGYSTG